MPRGRPARAKNQKALVKKNGKEEQSIQYVVQAVVALLARIESEDINRLVEKCSATFVWAKTNVVRSSCMFRRRHAPWRPRAATTVAKAGRCRRTRSTVRYGSVSVPPERRLSHLLRQVSTRAARDGGDYYSGLVVAWTRVSVVFGRLHIELFDR